jgi:hypothetical protein
VTEEQQVTGMQRYLNVAVQYEPNAPTGQQSLRWLFPELAGAGLSLTEDTQGMRQWVGVVDADTFARLAETWRLDPRRASWRRLWDGMEWESGGTTPVVWASVSVSQLERSSDRQDAVHPCAA